MPPGYCRRESPSAALPPPPGSSLPSAARRRRAPQRTPSPSSSQPPEQSTEPHPTPLGAAAPNRLGSPADPGLKGFRLVGAARFDSRPFGPSRAAIGVDASLGVPPVPIVPGRGRSEARFGSELHLSRGGEI